MKPTGWFGRRQEAEISVSGAVAKPGAWSVARLMRELAAEIRPLEYPVKEEKRRAKCVPLYAVVKASEPRLNPKAKNHFLAFAVFVRAADGYTACFSGSELMADAVGKGGIWIALDRNGQPIPGDDGPVELIVPGDTKPSRWVHGISRILVVDGIAATESRTGQ